MTRTTAGRVTKQRHKKILKLAKGYRGRAKNCYRIAIEKVEKALQYAYRDRKVKKREFRALWIQRINAGTRMYGLSYSKFMNMFHKAGLELNRKVLADLAMNHPDAFKSVVDHVKANGTVQTVTFKQQPVTSNKQVDTVEAESTPVKESVAAASVAHAEAETQTEHTQTDTDTSAE